MSDGPHLEMTVLISEGARHHHLPLFSEIVHRAHRQGLAGASVFRGIEGFGHTHHMHEPRVLDVPAHLPVVVIVVDTEPRIRAFADEVQALAGAEGVVTLRAVEVLSPVAGRR